MAIAASPAAGRSPRTRSRNSRHHRRRELRRSPEPAALRVEVAPQRARPPSSSASWSKATPPRQLDGPGQCLADPRWPASATSPDRLVHASSIASSSWRKRRLAVPRLVGEVGAGEERAALVVEHARHRPAALPGHRDGRLHVDRVDVRPLLAVDLDAHVVLVHVRRRGLVLERLVRHHVAPVACGVPDAQQHRHVALARLRERLLAPLLPVDGVVLVLEEVRRGGTREPVRHGSCLPQTQGPRGVAATRRGREWAVRRSPVVEERAKRASRNHSTHWADRNH